MMAILGDEGKAGDVGADDGSLEYGEDADDAKLSERPEFAEPASAALVARIGDAAAFTLAKVAARDKFSKFCCKFCSVNLEG